MFNKTIRSALSLALVLCMVLGLCGNALAVNVPGGATVTNRFNSVIEQLETAIDNLEAQIEEHEKTLADGEAKLEDGKAKLEEGKQKLAELKQLLADADNAINEEGGYQDQLDEARALWQSYMDAIYEEGGYEDQLEDALKAFNEKLNEVGLGELKKAMDDAEAAYNAAVDAREAELAKLFPELIAAFAEAEAEFDRLNEEYGNMWNEAAEKEGPLLEQLWALFDEGKDYGDPEVDALDAQILAIWEAVDAFAMEVVQPARMAWYDAMNALNAKRYGEEMAAFNEAVGQAELAWYDAQDAYYAQYNIVNEASDYALSDAEDQYWNKYWELDAAKWDLQQADMELTKAQNQMDQAVALIADAEEAIKVVEAEMEEAEGVIADAEAILADAKPAMEQAKLTIADARAVIANLKGAYADLQDAINNPKANAAFVKELIRTMQADMRTLWTSVKDLQDSANALLDAYAKLEGKSLVYDGFEYYHEAVRYELPNGDVYEYPEVFVKVEGFTYNMPQLPASAERLVNLLDTVITRAVTAYQTARYYWLLAKDRFNLDITISVESLDLLTRANARKVYDWLYNNPDKVVAAVKEYGLYALELLTKYGPYGVELMEKHSDIIVKTLKLLGGAAYLGADYIYAHSAGVMGFAGKAIDFLMQYKGQVMDVARKLYAKYGDEAKALINVYVDYLNLEERYADAIHADYTIYHDSLYVALGDQTATGAAEKLAGLLQIANAEDLTGYGMSVGDAILQVGENAELIAKADLITLGFSNLAADQAMLNALAGEDVTNWTKVLDERLVDAIESALALLRDRLTTDGYPTQAVDQLIVGASAYIYHYAARAVRFPQLVSAIREVNEDALIVITGAYNELDNVVVEYAGREINLGSINRFLVKATNLENLLQAMYTEGVVYASAYEVETVYEANGAQKTNLMGLLMSFMDDEMLPSEAGEAYIAEQIFNTLTVKYEILGDVNGDHRVNCRDVRLLMCYVSGMADEADVDLAMADVNGDGRVNARDVRLLMLYVSGMAEHFPACDHA